MNQAHGERHLGEYQLEELLSENTLIRTWRARQTSISRQVLVDELRADRLDQKEIFLADVRAKAAVEHPLIGSVYEAVDAPEHCFCVRELLHGETLEKFPQADKKVPPAQLALLLRQVAVAQLHQHAAAHATSPLNLQNLHLDEHGVIRLDNLAIAGARSPGESARDIAGLGEALHPLVASGQAGSNRMLTLLSWMRGEGLEIALDWQQVADLCTQIDQQLSEPAPVPPSRPSVPINRHSTGARLAIAIAAVFGLLIILALLIHMGRKHEASVQRVHLPEFVKIPSGRHVFQDGNELALKAFRISPCEVTIGQYAEFLETLEMLAKDSLERSFDHAEQPPEKAAHIPDDWPSLLAAAKSGGLWNRRPVTTESPVVGVDWWDAAAYAEWKKARLPNQ